MAIVGDHPETGVRFVLNRAANAPDGATGSGPPWIYRGDAFTPDARFELEVHVAADGVVRVAAGPDVPAEIGEKVRLLFRTLYRQAKDTPGGEPPRKVVRWKGEK